jgi:hypothetical protein
LLAVITIVEENLLLTAGFFALTMSVYKLSLDSVTLLRYVFCMLRKAFKMTPASIPTPSCLKLFNRLGPPPSGRYALGHRVLRGPAG